VAPVSLGGLTLDVAGSIALASALRADVAAVAALLPDIRAGMMSGFAKSAQERPADG
jgi:hypothetical protein